jgi:hypothetical protein
MHRRNQNNFATVGTSLAVALKVASEQLRERAGIVERRAEAREWIPVSDDQAVQETAVS